MKQPTRLTPLKQPAQAWEQVTSCHRALVIVALPVLPCRDPVRQVGAAPWLPCRRRGLRPGVPRVEEVPAMGVEGCE